jgi:hypothetical protein
MKLPKHVFHSLYVFDYIQKDISQAFGGGGKIIKKFAPWPIVSPLAVFAGEKEPGEGITTFNSEEDAREYLYSKEDLEDKNGKKLEVCKNFVRIPVGDIVKYRGLFHNMIKSFEIQHAFKHQGNGSLQRSVDKPCCENVYGVSSTAKYDSATGGHQCDRARWSFYYGRENVGTINLNNESDGGSRSSGPFSRGSSQVAELKVGRFLYLSFDPIGDVHQGVNACEVERTGGKKQVEPFGTSSDTPVEVCYEFEDPEGVPSYPDIACCCPPVREIKDGKSPRDYREEDVKDYECTRSHKFTVDADIQVKSDQIFEITELEDRIPSYSLIRKLNDPEPQNSSEKKERGDRLFFNNKELFEKEWKFKSSEFKSIFRGNKPQFALATTRANDPIIAPLYTDKKYINIDIYNAPKFADEDSFKTENEIKSEKLGKIRMKSSFERTTFPSESKNADHNAASKYTLEFSLQHLVYIKSKKEYLCFVDLNSFLDVPVRIFAWSAGNRYEDNKQGKDKAKKFDEYWVHPGEFDNQVFSDLRMSTNRSKIGRLIDKDLVDDRIITRNGKLKKKEFSLELKGQSSSLQPLKFECFVYDKNKSTIDFKNLHPQAMTTEEFSEYENNKELGGVAPTVRNCLKGSFDVNWTFYDTLKLIVNFWATSDFSKTASYPSAMK